MNKLQAMLNGIADSEIVVINYRGTEVPMAKSYLLTKVDENGTGDVLDTGVTCTIDCVKRKDDTVIVELSELNVEIDSASVVDQITSIIQKKTMGMSHIQITLGCTQVDDVTYTDNHIGFVKIAENFAIRKGLFAIEDSVVLRHGKDSMRINKDNKYAATLEILSLCYGEDMNRAVMPSKMTCS
jgi:hypothetical protein